MAWSEWIDWAHPDNGIYGARVQPDGTVLDPGVELRLAIEPRVWDTGTVPTFALTFVNNSRTDIRIGSPIQGSWDGLRSPRYVEMGPELPGEARQGVGGWRLWWPGSTGTGRLSETSGSQEIAPRTGYTASGA